jgi:hypothetical protein
VGLLIDRGTSNAAPMSPASFVRVIGWLVAWAVGLKVFMMSPSLG